MSIQYRINKPSLEMNLVMVLDSFVNTYDCKLINQVKV